MIDSAEHHCDCTMEVHTPTALADAQGGCMGSYVKGVV